MEEGEIDSKPPKEDVKDKTPEAQESPSDSSRGEADRSPGDEDKNGLEEGEAEDKE